MGGAFECVVVDSYNSKVILYPDDLVDFRVANNLCLLQVEMSSLTFSSVIAMHPLSSAYKGYCPS